MFEKAETGITNYREYGMNRVRGSAWFGLEEAGEADRFAEKWIEYCWHFLKVKVDTI